MIICRNKILPFGRDYAAVLLFGILFVKKNAVLTDRLLNHEKIHLRQERELLYVFFYIIYVTEWLVRIIIFRGDNLKAYRSMSFEREAYKNEDDMSYLSTRKIFAQWR